MVAPGLYDSAYFLAGCAGADRWLASGGSERDPLYDGSLQLAGLRDGQALLDVGTGRGELLVAALGRGASRAVGVEYSPDGVGLAHQTLRRCGVADRAEILLGDARALPLADASFDLVTMLDVVEHLTGAELTRALSEARRVLRPGGKVFIHTFPTRTLYDVTYKLQRASRPGRWASWPSDPRNDLEHSMHVGEQSLRSLRRAMRRAAFTDVAVWPGGWIYADFVPGERERRLYYRLARVPGLRRFGVADLWAQGLRP